VKIVDDANLASSALSARDHQCGHFFAIIN
jgi:hypothetical protein